MSNQTYNAFPVAIGHVREHPLNIAKPRRIREFLNQDRYWVNSQLERVRIKDMDSEYLLATMIWLLKRSQEVMFVLSLQEEILENPTYLVNSELAIQQTPLFQRLRDRYLKLTNADN